MFRATATLPWDELHDESCADDEFPDWHTMIVTGPMKSRDARGRTTIQWTVSVQCQPPEAPQPNES